MDDVRKDYGPTGCVKQSIVLATLTTLLCAMARRPKGGRP